MKGRGVRTIDADELRAGHARRRGQDPLRADRRRRRHESLKTVSQPLERKRTVSFDKLIDQIAAGRRDDDAISTLAARLAALDRRIGDKDRAAIVKATGGIDLAGLASRLLDAIDPDALATAGAKGRAGARTEEGARGGQGCGCDALRRSRAAAPAEGREGRRRYPDRHDLDRRRGLVRLGREQRPRHGRALQAFLEERRDELAALQILYRLPYAQRRLTYEAVDDLKEALKRPPWLLEPVDIWRAYKRLASDKVRGNPAGTLADIVMLVRYALGQSETLEPLPSLVAGRFNLWLGREEKAGRSLYRRAAGLADGDPRSLAVNIEIRPEDMMDAPEFSARGGIVRARALFGARLPALLDELTDVLVA